MRILLAMLTILAPFAVHPARAGGPTYALAILGTPALPADFDHFPYVNPDAPKGGEVTLASLGSYDNFNPFILRGVADGGVLGNWLPGVGMAAPGSSAGHVWESLMEGSNDEIDVAYCHLCKTVELAPDKLSVTFTMRPEAKFADGTQVTAADVAWTFETLRAHGRPSYKVTLADVTSVNVDAPDRVTFRFANADNRELPLVVGGLPVLPKHFWDGRDFEAPLTDAPLGSGPYRVEHFELGRSVTYVRRPDWWAADMPTGRGLANFGRVHVEYYRDATVAFQAFKAGDIDLRQENISKQWATGYDFPAVTSGLVKRDEIPHHLPTGMQAIAMNTRRAVFADERVRRAMVLAYDFEWANKNLFFGAYDRTESYFSNSLMASSGVPQGAELALLEPFRDKLPADEFTQPYTLPVTDGSGSNREQLKQALDLLKQAGYEVRDHKLADANGNQLRFSILLDDPTYERFVLPYVQTLQKLAIEVSVRTVDPAQFQKLTDDFDFDMTLDIVSEGDLPGNEQRDYWSCASAKSAGSPNLAGVCSPATDALIDDIVRAQDRPTLQTAVHALDRTLLWGNYMVPGWHKQSFRVAYWNRFGKPDKPVREGFVFESWWVDPALAKATDAARGGK